MNNINIQEFNPLIKPSVLLNMLPTNNKILDFVEHTRREIQDILNNKSNKKLFIVGLWLSG